MKMMQSGSVVLLVLFGVILGINAQERPPFPPPDPVLPVVPTLTTPTVYPGQYIILAANTIRPGMPLTLSVTIFETQGGAPVSLEAAIIRDNVVAVSTTAILQTGTNQVTLQIPVAASAAGEYSLRVVGTGGLTINETRSLFFNIDHFSIFVQSDKAIYKPGQTVRYRVLAVYPDLKPYVGPFTLTVSDAKGNVIEQMMDKQPNKNGIISEEMVMSDQPVLGDWTIKAEAEGQIKEYTIKIDEYVLPKFEVIITVPPWMDASHDQVQVTVTAKYTFGKPVEGTVSLGAKLRYYNREIHKRIQVDNNGKAETNFTSTELLGLKRQTYNHNPTWYNNEQLVFTANMTETLTGITQQADEAALSYHSFPIKIVFQDSISRSNYKPGLPYHVYLIVSHQDGTPLTEEERLRGVELRDCRERCYGDNASWNLQRITIEPQTGVAEAFIASRSSDFSIQLSAEYKGVIPKRFTFPGYSRNGIAVPLPAGTYITAETKYLDKAASDSNTYIQVSPDNAEALMIGSTASFTVQSTMAPGKFTYQIVSRGNILESETISGVTGTEYVITKQITADMSPKSKLIVYFLTDAGEVVLDSLEFVVNVVFANPVTASFSKIEAEPGTSVSFDVDTTPGAFVGVLAIDKSVLLLTDGNDITHNQVLESVGRFDTTADGSGGFNPFFDFAFCFFPYPTNGNNAGSILKNAGIIYITDGNVVYVEEPWFRQEFFPVAAAGAGFGGARADMVPNAGAGRQNEAGVVPEKKIRKEFPETWLWVDTEADSAGHVSIQTNFPDTITSWVGTAISMDAQAGLGVTQNAAKATVFKNFFVSLNLPYSVIRGEKFVLEANVFNYLKQDVRATVQLQSSLDYYIIQGDQQMSTPVSKTVTVPSNKTATVNFAIEPTKNGMIELVVTATAGGEQDGVRRLLLVEPEGVAQEYVVSDLVDFSNAAAYSKTFSINLPTQDLVPDSVRAVITATGDILGPTMNNLDQLLRMPSGCGEQTMIGFAPDVFIYKYLTETGQGNPTIEQKALNYMKKGYQRELTYQHEDGSFSAWGGGSGDDGSTFLTAFVVRSFLQAAPYIYIDPAKMNQAITFLINHQNDNGSFMKSGRIVDQIIDGGISSAETLTAYCAIAMDQVRTSDILSDTTKSTANTALTNAMNYLVSRYTVIQEDKYAMAIVTYALALGGSPSTPQFLTRLNELQTVEDEGRLKYWTDQDEQTTPASDEFYYRVWRGPPSAAIEMTGYGMLAYLARNDVVGSIPVAGWLSQQRNSLGGYSSTQDTVIALLALTTYAERLTGGDKNMNLAITTTADPAYNQAFSINTQNSIILQQFELPVDSGNVTVEGRGIGSFLLSFILHYNMLEVRSSDVFDVTITILGSDTNSLELRACGRYTGNGEGTGMSIMDIGIPSGFYVEEDPLLEAIKTHEFATKHEITGKSVVIYLNEIPSMMETCINIQARRSNTVAATKPSIVKVYRYYTPEEQSVQSYSASALSATDICTMCPDCCNDGGGSGGAVPSTATSTLLLLTLTIFSIVGALVM
ncbi:CD109 antigen isoform X2 [Strongylocentrotus purpuratus]|uniref:CD109 antigen n=1 Tax=Strongylocentrotus purpuratus TaxID=7668 RepID=A0A7M7NPT7_STRPU|nr:CD109 antigen isoform X2 [Strongylocentrotus purpuratus]